MSRYFVDRLLYQLNARAELLERFAAEPAALVEEWLDGGAAEHLQTGDRISVLHVTDEERAALITLDHTNLYRLGIHPFLLWTVLSAVHRRLHPQLRFSERFVRDISPYGRPDFST